MLFICLLVCVCVFVHVCVLLCVCVCVCISAHRAAVAGCAAAASDVWMMNQERRRGPACVGEAAGLTAPRNATLRNVKRRRVSRDGSVGSCFSFTKPKAWPPCAGDLSWLSRERLLKRGAARGHCEVIGIKLISDIHQYAWMWFNIYKVHCSTPRIFLGFLDLFFFVLFLFQLFRFREQQNAVTKIC